MALLHDHFKLEHSSSSANASHGTNDLLEHLLQEPCYDSQKT